MRTTSTALALAAIMLLGTAAGASADDKVKLAIGQRGNWDTSVSEIGQRAGIFKKHGLELEIVYTQGAGEPASALRFPNASSIIARQMEFLNRLRN